MSRARRPLKPVKLRGQQGPILVLSLTDPEALSDQRVCALAVLRDQRGVVALLARVVALALQADPLADERRDDHLDALARSRRALRAPHQPVHAQPDDKQTRDQGGHPGIPHCPPQRSECMKAQAPGFRSSSEAPALFTDGNPSYGGRRKRRRRKNNNCLPLSVFGKNHFPCVLQQSR